MPWMMPFKVCRHSRGSRRAGSARASMPGDRAESLAKRPRTAPPLCIVIMPQHDRKVAAPIVAPMPVAV